jgi:sialidase-1
MRLRQRLGFRGRLSSALVNRQDDAGLEPTFGNGIDPQASIFHQADGPTVPGTNAAGPCYVRDPQHVKAANGDLLVFGTARSKQDDDAGYAIIMKRSTDGGRTWSAYQTIYSHATFNDDTDWIAGGSVVVDLLGSGAITYIFIVSSTSQHYQWIVRSIDHGVNWGPASEITSTVKVAGVNNPVGHTYNGTAWTWCAPGCTAGIQLTSGPNAGRLIVPFDHRFVFSTAQPSYSHTIKSDDGGATWSLHGGLSEESANEFSNECAITETSTPGRLVMHIRNTNSGVYRYQSVSTDYGATWSNMAALTALTGVDTSGDVKRCGNLLIASYSSDPQHAQRYSLTLAISRDDGATWLAADRRMVYGRPAGYSVLLIDGSTVYCLFERGQGNTSGAEPAEFAMSIQMLKTDRAWLLAPTLRYSQWEFNEEASGTAAHTVGGEIPDYGNLDERAVCGTAAVRPLYTADGIALTTGVDFIQLSPATDPAFNPYSGESLTVEVDATVTAAAAGAILSRMVSTTGYQLEVLSNVLKLTIGDGTNTVTITGTTAVNDGVRRTYGFVRDAVADQVYITINGVLEGSKASDTTVSPVQVSTGLLLGKKADDSLKLACTIHRARASRGIPATFWQPGGTKRTLVELRRYNPITLTPPALSIAAPVLWTHQTHNQGLDAYADLYLTERYPVPPPVGACFRSMRDASATRRKFICSEFRRLRYVSDAKMGPAFNLDEVSAVSGLLYDTGVVGATNGIDFIQNTCTFTVCFAVNFTATTGTLQTICDNCAQSSANPGFTLYRDNSTGKLVIYISKGSSTTRVTGSVAASPVLDYGTTYFIGIVGRGLSTAYDLYIAPIAANYNAASPTQPTVTKYAGSTPSAGAGPYDSTKYLRIGEYTEGGRGVDGALKNFMVFNDDATDADIDALALFCVSG